MHAFVGDKCMVETQAPLIWPCLAKVYDDDDHDRNEPFTYAM